ncbi:phosphate signaling complex protein PhoU [bacterium]|nr:phosphate signaling complex protein PhoU [bacterium]
MSKVLFTEIDRVKRELLSLSALVEENVHFAVKAVADRKAQLAQQVLATDNEIDSIEVRIEEECLKLLALHQPVALDLRLIIAVLKINNDLERIGDLAKNVAERAIALAQVPVISSPFDFQEMANKTRNMLRKSLQAFIELDATLAREVHAADDAIDTINRSAYSGIAQEIQKNPANAETLMLYLSVSRNLERIADHTTNIAEDVIYLVEGEIVRHWRRTGDNKKH